MTAALQTLQRGQESVRNFWNTRGPLGHLIRLIGTVVGFVVLYLVLRLLFRNNQPPQGSYLFGAVLGLLYALIAFGLILVYRANRIINFANAEIGAACAVFAVLLMKSRFHVPYIAALLIALATAVLAGALIEYLVIRRFASAPRVILSVATIGVGLIFAALQFFMPHWITGRFVDPAPPRTPFSGFQWELGGTNFTANHLLVFVVVGSLLVGLTAFFRFTDMGVAVRAVAENRDRAWLLGLPVKRVGTVVWVLSSVLAAVGVFLRAPIIGLPIGTLVGPSVLLYGLAAAVIARMEKFSVALVASVAIGIADQSFYLFSRDPSLGSAVILPVLLVVMLAQRVRQTRGQDSGVATWSLGQEFRPIPPELRWLPEVQWGRFGAAALLVGAMLAVPYTLSVFQLNLASVVLIYGIVAITLVVLTGWAGQISLGQWGFVGVGAAAASGMYRLHADFIVALVVAGAVGALAAVLIGLPALRIQGLYLAVTTLAFAIAVQVYLLSPNHSAWLLPDRSKGIRRAVLYGRFDMASDRTYYFFTLAILVLALFSARSLRNSRTGRVLVATRDNARGAQSYGVSVARARLTAFAFAGFWSGIGGGLFVYHQGAVDTLAFSPATSLDILVNVVVGGLTTLGGALLGTGVLAFFKYGQFSDETQFFASGVGVLIILVALPGGLSQLMYSARDSLLRRVAERRGIHVPSLLADNRQEVVHTDEVAVDQSASALEGAVGDATPHVVCPACRERVPVDDVLAHPHFIETVGAVS